MSTADMLSGVGGEALGEIGIAMLKKAQSIEASGAAQLVAQLPQTASSANIPGVGQNFDKVA
jgi:hypothetical protein